MDGIFILPVDFEDGVKADLGLASSGSFPVWLLQMSLSKDIKSRHLCFFISNFPLLMVSKVGMQHDCLNNKDGVW